MGGRILVVDDEPVVVKSCERTLTPEGYKVDTASNGKEAIGKLGKDNFDLVITDLKMPDMDGIELIRWIRNSKPNIGVVVITGYPSQESIKEALGLRILDYLPKPFSP
ncbi:MAG TPA: response regulator, partial [Thermodesulfovibrionales bacterium]|nr:response regulator [Thermodesulfovibrionales bacterium]